MVVQHNLQAMNANRMFSATTGAQKKSTEKLSSGYKINRAADDAAGLSISEKMRKQIRGLDRASTNAQDGISAVQTVEGALTEVHSMLQRMNELAVQAANGTNSESDRISIQNEIDQLTTEIDRVAETTKFNETYLLKGNGKVCTVKIFAKDAGLNGHLAGVGTGTVSFTMNALAFGDTITIGSKGYTIGTTIADIRTAITDGKFGVHLSDGDRVTVNGTEYTIIDNSSSEDLIENRLHADSIAMRIADGDKVVAGNKTFVAMNDKDGNGVSDNDSSVVSRIEAYRMIANELTSASSVGTDAGHRAKAYFYDTAYKNEGFHAWGWYTYQGTEDNRIHWGMDLNFANSREKLRNFLDPEKDLEEVRFYIYEGEAETKQGLQMSLHVGADADSTNKISFKIDTMTSAGLGINGLNLVDNSGAKATYAIDSISDAIAKVSAQRSELGAIQNRLEHTIANLDNVVENTTSAESEIRDTDMAEEMVSYSKNNILAQAGQAMLAQANQSNQGVLSLLG